MGALAAIKENDGYNYTLEEVVTWGADDFPFTGRFPAAGFVFGNDSRSDRSGTLIRSIRRKFGIEMWVKASQSTRRELTLSKIYEAIVADLEKALYVDHTRGGNAVDTEIQESSPAISEDKTLIGAMIQGEIIYRHQVGDAYTAM